MRKGYSLVELLAVIAVLAVISLPLSGLWTAILRDIPRAGSDIQQRAQLNLALGYMQRDINKAINIPDEVGDYVNDSINLIIQQTDTFVRYSFQDDILARYVLENSDWQADMQWRIPKAVIVWGVLKDNDKSYAVSIQSYIEQKKGSIIEKNLANSHMFFIGVRPEPEK